jgi:hypothetical protein
MLRKAPDSPHHQGRGIFHPRNVSAHMLLSEDSLLAMWLIHRTVRSIDVGWHMSDDQYE